MQCLDSNCKRCGADLKCLECNQLPHIEVRLGEGEGQRGVHLQASKADICLQIAVACRRPATLAARTMLACAPA